MNIEANQSPEGQIMPPSERESARTKPLGAATSGLILSVAALALSACSQRASEPMVVEAVTGRIVLAGATVVDTAKGQIGRPMDIVMDHGRIADIYPAGEVLRDDKVKRIDARGKFVVPGFLDMHAHVLGSDDPAGSLSLMLANGITGFRQMQGSAKFLEERRAGTLPFSRQAPELLAMPGEVLTPLNAATSEEARSTIKAEKAEGADFIKVIKVTPPAFKAAQDEARRQGMPFAGHLPDGVNAVEASDGGMASIEHLGPGNALLLSCSTDEAAIRREIAGLPPMKMPPKWIPFLSYFAGQKLRKLAVNPYADLPPDVPERAQKIMKTFSPDKCRDLAAILVRNHTWQVPTLIRLKAMEMGDKPEFRNDPNLKYVPSKTLALWKDVGEEFTKNVPASAHEVYQNFYALQLNLVKLFDIAGVRMMTGTDFGGGWLVAGFSLHKEFDELEVAGVSPLHVLQMTTLNGAEFLGKSSQMGSVAKGKNADLVLLDRNPLDSVQNLHGIYAVVRNGDYYSRQKLDQLIASAKAKQ